MKKYLHVISIGLQSNLAYRVNYLTRTLFSFIPLFAMLSLCGPSTRTTTAPPRHIPRRR